jgi:hypothetical protein
MPDVRNAAILVLFLSNSFLILFIPSPLPYYRFGPPPLCLRPCTAPPPHRGSPRRPHRHHSSPRSSSLQHTPWPRPPRQRATDSTDLPPCAPGAVPDQWTTIKLVAHCRTLVSTCFIVRTRSSSIALPASPRVLPVLAHSLCSRTRARFPI